MPKFNSAHEALTHAFKMCELYPETGDWDGLILKYICLKDLGVKGTDVITGRYSNDAYTLKKLSQYLTAFTGEPNSVTSEWVTDWKMGRPSEYLDKWESQAMEIVEETLKDEGLMV